MTELERYKRALAVAITELRTHGKGSDTPDTVGIALITVQKILNPPPEIEEVEVERWIAISNPDGKETLYEGKPSFTEDPRFTCIKLTGTLKRPKPQPVERSVRFTLYPDGRWGADGLDAVGVCDRNYPIVGTLIWSE